VLGKCLAVALSLDAMPGSFDCVVISLRSIPTRLRMTLKKVTASQDDNSQPQEEEVTAFCAVEASPLSSILQKAELKQKLQILAQLLVIPSAGFWREESAFPWLQEEADSSLCSE
jgi:hypothetical protein